MDDRRRKVAPHQHHVEKESRDLTAVVRERENPEKVVVGFRSDTDGRLRLLGFGIVDPVHQLANLGRDFLRRTVFVNVETMLRDIFSITNVLRVPLLWMKKRVELANEIHGNRRLVRHTLTHEVERLKVATNVFALIASTTS